MDIQLNEKEAAISSPEEFKSILENPDNAKDYPNIFAAAKQDVQEENPMKVLNDRYGDTYTSFDEYFTLADAAMEKAKEDPYANLPAPLVNAIQLAKSGKDYRDAITPDKVIDYSKTPTDKELLSLYFPNVYSEEDFNDDTKKSAIAQSKAAAQATWNLNVNTERQRLQAIQTDIEKRNNYYKSSIDKAMDFYKKQYPDATQHQMNSVRKSLESGTFYTNFFYDGKGGVREDAAVNLVPLVDGDTFLKKISKGFTERNNENVKNLFEKDTDVRRPNQQKAPSQEKKNGTDLSIFKEKPSPFAVVHNKK